jgi:adenylosuccinate synthase
MVRGRRGNAELDYYWFLLTDTKEALDATCEDFIRFYNGVTVVDWAWWSSTLTQNRMLDSEIIFEGAQGVLLDEDIGFHPHTTWSKCDATNALALLDGSRAETEIIGVIRGYHTRHGAGPFPSIFPFGGDPKGYLKGEHNNAENQQGAFRVGHFDASLTRYAANAMENRIGVRRGLFVTCLDKIQGATHVVDGYHSPLRQEMNGYGSGLLAARPRSEPERESQTQTLFEAFPYLAESRSVEPSFESRNSYAKALADRVGLPLRGVSHGPTHEWKRWAPEKISRS